MSGDRNPRKVPVVWLVLMGLAVWLFSYGPSFANCLGSYADPSERTSQSIGNEDLDHIVHRAEQAMRVGYREQARSLLEIAALESQRRVDSRREAISLGALGHAYLVDNRSLKAWQCINQGVDAARESGDGALLSSAYLNLANYQATLGGDGSGADLSFIQAIDAAENASRKDLAARARLNFFRIELRRSLEDESGIDDEVVSMLELAERDIRSLRNDLGKTRLLLAVGQRWSDAFKAYSAQDQFAARAYRAINAGLEGARRHERTDLEGAGLGAMGELYERAGRSAEALDLYRQAETIIRLSETPSNAYPWSWRMAKLLVAGGDRPEAIDAYQRAVDMTKEIRRSTANVQGHPDFAPTVLDDTQTLLSEYLEVLFDRQLEGSNNEALKAIRGLVEQQREVEVQTFFQDDCIADLRSRVREVDENVGAKTALMYPVALEQEWVMLVQIGESLWSERLDVSPESLAKLARNFRDALRIDVQKKKEKEEVDPAVYQRPGMALYNVLIEPFRSRLDDHDVDTLVIVPSGPLRSIPFAALYDGNEFLVSKYAIATVPGLSLLDSQSSASSPLRALIGGLTTASEEYKALPYVAEEIEQIRASIPDGATLEGTEFISARLQRTLDADPYTVVHVASHAEIGASAADSFIVTHDGDKLGLDRLEDLLKSSKYRDQPVQLLTLSACDTAAGVDENRAALGLAGIAVKSGARSAIGTLWPVFDKSSAVMMGAFYKALTTGGGSSSKAEALQQAQISLLQQQAYKHPVHWAPYLLIGSWN